MTAVANPPSFQQTSRSAWSANVSQGGLNAMNADEVARMFMPRKSAQRANSSSSISSNSSTSSTTTIPSPAPQLNGVPMQASNDLSSWGTAAARKKTQRAGPWPTSKAEALSGVSGARPSSTLTTNGGPSATSMTAASPIVPSQHLLQSPTQQINGNLPATQPVGEGNPVLYLLSMNGTFERKTISVPFYPDSLRIGRQTNAKTVPTPANGFFDSKVLSRQHAEIWADRNGKIWIRDVKSSNGTFVNGARLSAENRDSEPHELQTQDHLELGIDIVSEDQKTVVHHKVAAKVEHAGFLGATNNVMDMNFGDLDPANGAMMLPSQGSLQMRGRAGSQGSVGSNGRLGPPTSVAGSQMSVISQQRPLNFWLTPVTTEQIVKRLAHEMRAARLQSNDLGRTDTFFGSLLSKEDIKENDKAPAVEAAKAAQVNGTSLPFRTDPKPRFSDPPAPPPQQPLPEKPDVARTHNFEPSPSLKRTNTERPRSVPNESPVRQEPTSQILTLVEALASAKKEIDIQSARMKDLEEMLQKERQARELAEEAAKRLELLQSEPKTNGHVKSVDEGSIVEDAFEPPAEVVEKEGPESSEPAVDEKAVDSKVVSESTLLLEKRLEAMLGDMQELRNQMEAFKQRAETAESERDEERKERKTLAEMVEKIRQKESAKRSSSTERARSPAGKEIATQHLLNGKGDSLHATLGPLLEKAGLTNGSPVSSDEKELGRSAVGTLSRPIGGPSPLLYHTTPYASMLGVVLIGMGVMAYLNGWQPPKVDR
ncbi:cytoplasm to vacuole targeting protein-like protein Vps64 [Hyaloscypha finlandica]|nr:cytoplasm to vacuole targeting protein-like protein Vps64 [Hyaloscypha finlandica]